MLSKPTLKAKPREYDAVLGGDLSSPITAAVLGGTAVLNGPTRALVTTIAATGQEKVVHTPLTDPYALNLFDQIPDTGENWFLSSLKKQRAQNKPFSDRQMVYVHEWAIEFLKEKAFGSQDIENTILLKISEMLGRASANLQYPKIRLANSDKEIVTLSKNSENSRYPGAIGIYGGDRVCFGRIENSPSGETATFRKAKNCPEWIELAILDFAKDEIEGAKTFARLTGRCCFCNAPLTDEKSTIEGYGPVCAKNYQLPWGNKRR